MKVRWLLRYDPIARIYRILAITWVVGIVGDGNGYSSKFSIGLRARLFSYRTEYQAWILTLLGVRLHYQRSYGGIYI